MTHLSDETLNELLDQALSPELRAGAETHLSACAECATRLANLRGLFAAVEALPDLPLGADFVPLITTRLARQQPLPRSIHWLAMVQGLAAVLTVILAWPLLQTLLPPFILPTVPPARQALLEFLRAWSLPAVDFSLPRFSLQIPVLPVEPSSLGLILTGIALLWLATNGLLLIPRIRRTL